MNDVLRMRISVGLVLLWMFLLGWITAIGFGRGHGWSEHQFTLYFLEGDITGYQFMELFRIFQWLFVILTIVMLVLTLWNMREGQ